jgi:hypothetical protein
MYGYIDNLVAKQVSLAAVTYDYLPTLTLRKTSGSWESNVLDMVLNSDWGM